MSEPNPFESEEWLAYADRAMTELVPKIEESSITVSLVPKGQTDIKFALELGLSIMLDKPIIALVAPGVAIPAKLAMVADEIVEADFSDGAAMADRLYAAVDRVLPKEM